MRLDEAAIRVKVIELYDGCDLARMNAWLVSGIRARVLDPDVVERVMVEELAGRSHAVREYWLGPCECSQIANLS